MRPRPGDIVTSSDGLRGRVIKVVDEDPRWGGPWAALVEYQYVEKDPLLFEEGGFTYTLHEWVTASEWGSEWK